jgi:hypothetical protein
MIHQRRGGVRHSAAVKIAYDGNTIAAPTAGNRKKMSALAPRKQPAQTSKAIPAVFIAAVGAIDDVSPHLRDIAKVIPHGGSKINAGAAARARDQPAPVWVLANMPANPPPTRAIA